MPTRFAITVLPAVLALSCGLGCGSDGPRTPAEATPKAPASTTPAPTEPSGGGEVVLTVGGSGAAAGLELTLVSVSDDSRCPVDVTCVWEGDAIATVEARAADSEETFQLHLNVEPRSTVVEGRKVTFRSLQPPAVSGQAIASDDYRATFLVEPV